MKQNYFLLSTLPKNNCSYLRRFIIATMLLLSPFLHLYSQTNLALNKPVVPSSLEQGNLEFDARKAVDGNMGSRWASGFNQVGEWIYVDLGANYDINRVVLRWEGAYGTGYKIQISSDAVFTDDETAIPITDGDGGIDDLTVSGNGRYVRMLGTAKFLPEYGYSLYEFEVYGTATTPTNPPSSESGSITLVSGLSNTSPRPAISAGTMPNGEIRSSNGTNDLLDDGFIRLSAGGGSHGNVKSYIELSGYSTIPDMNKNIVFGTSGIERMRIDPDGKVGIGTSSPDEKLTVKGKIHTQEIRVDMAGPLVPDYVFANDYKLKTLQEVEAFIAQNSHLPEIPSAQEIEKNGLMLAEMNMSLLKKMEEMTLYMIEQNKRIEKLEKENKLKIRK